MTNSARADGPAVDPRHLLIIGAGPGLGGAIAHRLHEAATTSRSWPGAVTHLPNWPPTWQTPVL